MSTVFTNKLSRRASFAALAAAFVALSGMSAPAAEAEPFALSVSNAKAKAGEAANVVATISAGPGYHANEEYPHKAVNLAGDGVELPGGTTVKGSVSGGKIVISVPVKPKSAGKHKVTGQLRFSVCNDSQCVIKKVALDAVVTGT